MSRYRVWVHDSSGIHTPSHPFGSRRFAEVFAANRSRFRRDCFVIVCAERMPNTRIPDNAQRALVSYRSGNLNGSVFEDSFNPEAVIVQVSASATVYALAEKRSA
jgi:hypothetical protein